MTISLIEAAQHHEVVNVYIKMLRSHVDNIFVYTWLENKEYFVDLAYENVSFTYCDNQKLFDDFIQNNIGQIRFCDQVIYTSNESKDNSKLFHPALPNAHLLVHNFAVTTKPYQLKNLWIEPSRALSILAKTIKSFFTKTYSNRTVIFRGFRNILVPSAEILQFVKENYDLQDKQLRLAEFYGCEDYLPFSKKISQSRVPSIVIPATIDHKTRDYSDIVYLVKNLNIVCEITLLGMVKERSILDKILRYANKCISIRYSLEGYTTQEYEDSLSTADLVILPLKKFMQQGIGYEMNGLTNLSGSINDTTRFIVPFLYSFRAIIPKDISGLCKVYHSPEELSYLVHQSITNPFLTPYIYDEIKEKHSYTIKGKTLLERLNALPI
jgi:hypothetical protein